MVMLMTIRSRIIAVLRLLLRLLCRGIGRLWNWVRWYENGEGVVYHGRSIIWFTLERGVGVNFVMRWKDGF